MESLYLKQQKSLQVTKLEINSETYIILLYNSFLSEFNSVINCNNAIWPGLIFKVILSFSFLFNIYVYSPWTYSFHISGFKIILCQFVLQSQFKTAFLALVKYVFNGISKFKVSLWSLRFFWLMLCCLIYSLNCHFLALWNQSEKILEVHSFGPDIICVGPGALLSWLLKLTLIFYPKSAFLKQPLQLSSNI